MKRSLLVRSVLLLAIGCGGGPGEADAGARDDASLADGGRDAGDAGAERRDAGARVVDCAHAWGTPATDLPSDLLALPEGGVVVTGSSADPDTGGLRYVVGHLSGCDGLDRWAALEVGVGRQLPSLARLPDGTLAVVGSFSGTFRAGEVTEEAVGEASGFVAYFEADGEFRDARFFHPDPGSVLHPALYLRDVASNDDGALWLVGGVSGRWSPEASEPLDGESFLARIDASGAVDAWPLPGQVQSLATSALGPVVTGTFEGVVRVGGHELTSSDEDADAYVVAMDLLGAVRWAVAVGDGGTERTADLVASGDGVHLLLEFYRTSGVGLPDLGDWGRALVTLAAEDGAVSWARPAGGLVDVLTRTRLSSAGGVVWVSGAVMAGATRVGDMDLDPERDRDGFVAGYDAGGALVRVHHFPSPGPSRAHATVVDGEPVVAVAFGHGLPLGPDSLESVGGWDLALLRLR